MTVPMRSNLRTADADREAIVERLATVLSEGRLGSEEHELTPPRTRRRRRATLPLRQEELPLH